MAGVILKTEKTGEHCAGEVGLRQRRARAAGNIGGERESCIEAADVYGRELRTVAALRWRSEHLPPSLNQCCRYFSRIMHTFTVNVSLTPVLLFSPKMSTAGATRLSRTAKLHTPESALVRIFAAHPFSLLPLFICSGSSHRQAHSGPRLLSAAGGHRRICQTSPLTASKCVAETSERRRTPRRQQNPPTRRAVVSRTRARRSHRLPPKARLTLPCCRPHRWRVRQ